MLVGLSIKIAGTVVELLLPLILTHILEQVIVTESITDILGWGVIMILVAAAALACNIIANRMAARVTNDCSRRMRRELFGKMMRLSASDTDRVTVPSLEARITSDTYNVHSFVGMMQRMGVRAPILLVGGMSISFLLDAHLALVMLATLPFIFLTVFLISRRGVPLYSDVQSSVDRMVRVVREDVQGIRVIKALSKTDYEMDRYDSVNRTLSKKECRAGIIMGSVNPIMTMLMNLGIAGVVAVAAYRVAGGGSSAATVIAFMQYFTLISMAMMSLSRIFVMFTKCSASASRIKEIMDIEEGFSTLEDSKKRDTGCHIRFSGVSFSYLGRRRDLKDVSFSLPRGGRLGVIGATGSGKSTLTRLLMRFYDTSEGVIEISGRDLRSYTHEELTAMFGVCMQSDFLMADTIEENISFGRDLPHEEIVRAARIAQAEEFILSKEGGYSHVLAQKGADLSGGQRQRLLIARAIAGRPEILILDDSSSALDYKTDSELRLAIARELEGATVITVAQRVSSVKNCEIIILLDGGEVIGMGSHEELLSSSEEYREISRSQMGGAFIE